MRSAAGGGRLPGGSALQPLVLVGHHARVTDVRSPSPATDALPARGPFALRARVLTPLAAGGTRFLSDGVVVVDAGGRITSVEDATTHADGADRAGPDSSHPGVIDLRPWVLMPGLVDLHAHLPQLPSAGLGAGLHLLEWLDRYVYPRERAFDRGSAAVVAPAAFARMASLGTTTVVLYGAAWAPSTDEAFRAAEAHGIRLVAGRVMMDRVSYREAPPAERLGVELGESAELCERWHGRDDGRLSYAFTPRFAVACSAELLRASAELARSTGAYWQTHLSEDRDELAEVARLFPDARDYLDVYDLAGALGPKTIVAHAIHLSDREVARLGETGTAIAHCPESNLFLASGAMPLARYHAAGLVIGLGSDVAAGPSLSLFSVMRAGAYTHDLLRSTGEAGADGEVAAVRRPRTIAPLDWLRLGTLEGARALGVADRIGSLEAGKEADLIAVDPRLTAPLPGFEIEEPDEPDELMSRLVFRPHPEMVRGAWVRGRRLPDGRWGGSPPASAREAARDGSSEVGPRG
jgi:guanine deaminase